MRKYKNVKGSQEVLPSEIEVNIDTVYIRTSIKRIEEENFSGWQYDETQYDVKEYIQLIGNKNTELNKSILLLESENEVNMLAMTEMYEEKLKLEQENNNAMIAITEIYEMLLGGN